MKILWQSVAPWTPSGYGQQTALFAPRIRDAGHDVAISAIYGLEGNSRVVDGFKVYPTDISRYGKHMLKAWVKDHGDGNPDSVQVITLQDVWTWVRSRTGGPPADFDGLRIAAWVPVDHEPAPGFVCEALDRYKVTPIAMSRFGEEQLRLRGFDPLYVPHGVDTNVYRPAEDPRGLKEAMGLDPDVFVVGMVANNTGQSPPRKAFPQVFQAFAHFHARHPDSFLYLHSEILGMFEGINLHELATACGLPAGSYGSVAQDKYLAGAITQSQMASVYSIMDVLANPSYGEGFGIPIIEAQACFPAGTDVEVIDPLATHTKSYTGRMVTITTGRGSFEATDDHPIWTSEGWQSAGRIRPGAQILYCADAAEGMEQVHTGAIDEVVAALQDDAIEGSGSRGRHVVSGGVLSTTEPRAYGQALLGDREDASIDYDARPVALHGGARGWRRDGHDPQAPQRTKPQREHEALRDRLKYGQATDGLVALSDSDALGIRGFASDSTRFNVLSLLGAGPWLSPSIRGVGASAGTEGGSHAAGHRMDEPPFVSIQDGPLDPASARDRLADPRSEYDTVTAVSERHVRDLPVYNVTTKSSTYRVGAGYLVHNCGTPVIVTDWTAMPELCGAGWKVEGELWWDSFHSSWFMAPSIGEIVAALDAAYDAREDAALRVRAREFALGYDADLVMEKYWLPVLEQLDRPREVGPLPNREMRRRAAKKKVAA